MYALNWLCQKGKHRKPVVIGAAQQSAGIGGNGHIRRIAIWGTQDVESGAPLAFLDADPGIQLNFTIDIAFRETSDASTQSAVIPMLREFSRLTASIIGLFE